jgi:predicted RNase H-like nuclease (RuvC/YqgF family)
MTNEEMQKAMEFILNHQAQSSAKIDGILEAQKESQKDAEKRWKRSEETWTRTEEGIRALLSIAEIHEREIATLGEQIAAVGARIAEVSENGRATDERLNALINTVERQISEGRNGKS